jgi:hypothetical protein
MIPRLEAEEMLTAINVAALAAGAGERHERARIFAALERKATGADRAPAAKAQPSDLAGMGIAVRGEDGPAIADLGAWLGNPAAPETEAETEAEAEAGPPSSSAAVGDQPASGSEAVGDQPASGSAAVGDQPASGSAAVGDKNV